MYAIKFLLRKDFYGDNAVSAIYLLFFYFVLFLYFFLLKNTYSYFLMNLMF